MNIWRKLLNLPVHYYRQNLWRIHPQRWQNLDHVAIDRPIFLLGVQGGGLTLLARMLRRHSRVVSVTGNYRYWAGPDEMQNVMSTALPLSLTGLHHKSPPQPAYQQRDGLYAIDDLLPLYRETAVNANDHHQSQFIRLIRLAISIHAGGIKCPRFVDKSQSFTVRLSLVNRYLRHFNPHFVLVTRNPYAVCYRYATRLHSYQTLAISLKERLHLAAQHWANSFNMAIQDAGEVENFMILPFEHLLLQPRQLLPDVCAYANLNFEERMLPGSRHKFPLGATGSAKGDHKWYPLRPDVNRRYLDELEPWMIDVIKAHVEPLAKQWRYSPEGP